MADNSSLDTAPIGAQGVLQEKVTQLSNKLTASPYFHKLVDYAYSACDPEKTNHIGKSDLYAGLLLVHVKLAKVAGSAATFPPDRSAVDKMFDACDTTKSGGINRKEFDIILSVSCAQVFGRILINWLTMIFVIPYYAKSIVDSCGLKEGTYWETVAEQFCGLFLFFLIIPFIWGAIDDFSQKSAGKKADKHRNLEPEKEVVAKKDD